MAVWIHVFFFLFKMITNLIGSPEKKFPRNSTAIENNTFDNRINVIQNFKFYQTFL